MHSIKNCFCSSKPRYSARFKDHAILAAETTFNVNEVEALHVLFEQLSRSTIDDGLIHKEEFKLALINSESKNNLFADRLFELFDVKKNGAIEFKEFVTSLSIFHPDTPDEDKIAFAFRLYDLSHTGYIERDELKEMVSATLSELDIYLSDDAVQAIVEKTLWEADLNGDGKIDLEEWKEMAARNLLRVRRENRHVAAHFDSGTSLIQSGHDSLSFGCRFRGSYYYSEAPAVSIRGPLKTHLQRSNHDEDL